MTAPFPDMSTLLSLTSLADSGELRLADDVASACVNACDALIDELVITLTETGSVTNSVTDVARVAYENDGTRVMMAAVRVQLA